MPDYIQRTASRKPPMGNMEWWQIVVGFGNGDVAYAADQLRHIEPHTNHSRKQIRAFFLRAYEQTPSYLRAVVNTVNPKTQTCVFPKLSRAVQARIQAGEKPVDIFHGTLTKAEAHDALTHGYVLAVPYLMRDVHRALGGQNVRDVTVARWLAAVIADPARLAALTREQARDDGAGYHFTDSYRRHIDDLCAEDIDNGIKTGVPRAFQNSRDRMRRMNERVAAQQEEVARQAALAGDRAGRRLVGKPIDLIPEWYVPVEGIEILTSREALDREGREMHHCVAGYNGYVQSGDCSILKIRTKKGKSTAEVRYEAIYTNSISASPITELGARYLGVDRTLVNARRGRTHTIRVIQHKGPCNALPHADNVNLLMTTIGFWHERLDEMARNAAGNGKSVAVPQTDAPSRDVK